MLGRRTPSARPAAERMLAYAVVAAQTALIGYVFFAPPRRAGRRAGPARLVAAVAISAGAGATVIGAAGLGTDLTPLPLPPARGRLRTGGPYAVVRHPVYAGVMLATTGRALEMGGRARTAAAAALCALLVAKARWEERRLRDRFPAYEAYARRTPAFVPSLGPVRLKFRRAGGGAASAGAR